MKTDRGLMIAIVAGGAFAVGMAVSKIAAARSATDTGLNGLVNLDFRRQRGMGAVIDFQPQRSLRGWGTPGFGRGVGSAIYWRRVS